MDVLRYKDIADCVYMFTPLPKTKTWQTEIRRLSQLYDQVQEQILADEEFLRPRLNVFIPFLTSFVSKYQNQDIPFIINDIFEHTWIRFSFVY
jgi:hypothetical protein